MLSKQCIVHLEDNKNLLYGLGSNTAAQFSLKCGLGSDTPALLPKSMNSIIHFLLWVYHVPVLFPYVHLIFALFHEKQLPKVPVGQSHRTCTMRFNNVSN